MPQTRAEFWKEKFAANVARDQRAELELGDLGWSVHVIWECELRSGGNVDALLDQLASEVEQAYG